MSNIRMVDVRVIPDPTSKQVKARTSPETRCDGRCLNGSSIIQSRICHTGYGTVCYPRTEVELEDNPRLKPWHHCSPLFLDSRTHKKWCDISYSTGQAQEQDHPVPASPPPRIPRTLRRSHYIRCQALTGVLHVFYQLRAVLPAST